MDKRKLLIISILAIFVVAMSLSAVSAVKYKKTTVKAKFDKTTTKKLGNYKILTFKKRYSDADLLLVAVAKGKTTLKGNKYYTKLYYKQNGKNKVSKWNKGSDKYKYQYYTAPKTVKINKVGVKIPVSNKKTVNTKKKNGIKSITVRIKDTRLHSKKLKNGDSIGYIYETSNYAQYPRGVNVEALDLRYGLESPKHTKLVKATVWFKKNSKTIKKSGKAHNNYLTIKLVNGYKPYKVKAYYKNK